MKKAFVGSVAACLIVASATWGEVGGGNITFSVKGAGNVVMTSPASRALFRPAADAYRPDDPPGRAFVPVPAGLGARVLAGILSLSPTLILSLFR